MENGTAPAEITEAIIRDNLGVVKTWLDNGGDPNALIISSQGPILLLAAWYGRGSIIDLLLSRGADIDATDADGRTAVYEMLNHWTRHRSLPALRVLLSHGADVNLARTHNPGSVLHGMSPLMIAASAGGPDMARLLLRAGADPEHRDGVNCTAEETYRSTSRSENALKCADLLRDVRLAGGWKRYVLQPKYDLLVLRALCHRGRTTLSARTPEVLVRLFSAPDGRRRTRSTRATAGVRRVHLPDPLFWRVLEFALGPVYDYPWVRQRLRARAAAVAAAE